jgi:CO/xanthine dehydrogenase FAD-binding subunit
VTEKKPDQLHVYKPRTLRELAGLLKEFPEVPFIAGATDFMQKHHGEEGFSPPPYLISLADVDEMTKIRRRENVIDIGAAVPLERIISLGANVVPRLLIQALARVAGAPVRNLATLGGNIMLASPFSDALLPLLLLEARCEIRRLTAHAWMPLSRLVRSPWKTTLHPSEVLASISIPVAPWDVIQFEKLDIITQPALSMLKFAGAARVWRSTVTDLRIIFGGVNPLYARNREIDALLIGAKIPFAQKIADQFKEHVVEFVEGLEPTFLPDKYHRVVAVRLAHAFLEKVSSYREMT